MQASDLFELKEKLEGQKILERQIETLELEVVEKQRDLEVKRKALAKESLDLERMEKVSLSSMLSYIQGQYDAKLEKERMEAIEAKLAYDSAFYEAETIADRLKGLQEQRIDTYQLQSQYDKLLKEKEEELMDSDHHLKNIVDALGKIQGELQEIDEAIDAGLFLGDRLGEVEKALRSAKNWGIFDMLGGDFIADIGKHMKISHAQKMMAEAKVAYTRFNSEMDDIGRIGQMDIEVSGLMTAADFFFDNIFVDFMVQSKLTASLDNIAGAQRQLHGALEGLQIKKNEVVFTLNKMERSREEFLRSRF